MAILYIIPNELHPDSFHESFPAYNFNVIQKLKYFFVETPKAARQLLKKSGVPTPFDDIHFYSLKDKMNLEELSKCMQPLVDGYDMGLISDAGYPAIADPGESVVALSHQMGITVKPLIGPSSFLLALVSSGLNAEQFTFHGYLPIKQQERIKSIRQLEKTLRNTSYTQVFMETPYRNNSLMTDLLTNLNNDTLLSMAVNITAPDGKILTMSVSKWKHHTMQTGKQPAIFLIGYYAS